MNETLPLLSLSGYVKALMNVLWNTGTQRKSPKDLVLYSLLIPFKL